MNNLNTHWSNSSVEKVAENLKKQRKILLDQLWNLRNDCYPLFQELSIWPKYTEWRRTETFNNVRFKRWLENRLDSFKERLKWEYPKYENIISLYCLLYATLEINPCNIRKEDEILDILSKRENI